MLIGARVLPRARLIQLRRWALLTTGCAAVVALMASPRVARADDLSQGFTVGVEARLTSLLWEEEFSGVVEGANSAARFDVDRSVRSIAFGGAARGGWKLAGKEGTAFVLGGVFSMVGTPDVPVRYDTGLNRYEFSARGRWYTMSLYYEVQAWKIFAANAGIGYGGILRWQKVGDEPSSERATRSHVVALGLRLRVPPGAPVAGYIGLGHELMGLNPLKAFWEGRWTIATYSYLAAGVEFDSLGLQARK